MKCKQKKKKCSPYSKKKLMKTSNKWSNKKKKKNKKKKINRIHNKNKNILLKIRKLMLKSNIKPIKEQHNFKNYLIPNSFINPYF